MSHFTKVKTRLHCLATLEKAIDEMGWKLDFSKTEARGFGSERYPVAFAADLRCGLDLGFVESPDGYEIVADWDFIGRRTGLTETKVINEIQRRYAYLKVLEQAKAAGFTVVEDRRDNDERVTLRVRRWK